MPLPTPMARPSATLLAQSVLSGMFVGALYGLLGLGLSLSWGLLKLINLAHFGFAFLAECNGRGYATEAAAAVLHYGRTTLGLPRIVAITAPDNTASARVLEKIGLRSDRLLDLPGYPGGSRLFVPA